MAYDINVLLDMDRVWLTGYTGSASLTVSNPGENNVDFNAVTYVSDPGFGDQEIIDWPSDWLRPGESETYGFSYSMTGPVPNPLSSDRPGVFSWVPGHLDFNHTNRDVLLPLTASDTVELKTVVQYGGQLMDSTETFTDPLSVLPGGQITSAVPRYDDGVVVVDLTVSPTHDPMPGEDHGTSVVLKNVETGDYDYGSVFFGDATSTDTAELSLSVERGELASLRLGTVANLDRYESGVDSEPEIYNPVDFVVQAGKPRDVGDVLIEGIGSPSEIEL